MTNPAEEIHDRVRVEFQLEQDDGWPPVASERLWAVSVDTDLVRIDNVPWFVSDLALNDLVETRTDSRGQLVSAGKISWSGNCTVRIIPYAADRFPGGTQGIIDRFTALGVQAEANEQFGLIALNVPSSANISGVKGLLASGFEADWWDYEESCVGKAWENM
ncbi:DUF4265 domain-containing protein (plasmid) [Streptomyces sp. NBC_01201]|uniref:DUF4265 domain-containing protein n=1 Tax=Streptomyces sp. NBC_01201 TaxID=2903770 RepID=UPI002E127C80|nr:DUF4265 domain-containing protein [Streptomyces sp. NBC_01201]